MPATDRSVDLTEGPLLRPLLALSLPLVGTQLLQVAYNLVDTFVVGRLGDGAVAALTYSLPFIFLTISLGSGLTVAGTVLVSQHRGAGNDDRVRAVAGQTIAVTAVVSGFLSVVGYLLTPTLLPYIGTTPGTAIHAMAVEYTRIVFAGTAFMFGAFAFQAILRGWGDTKTPMYLMFGSVVANAVLDPFFVLGFDGNVVFSLLGLGGLEATLYALTGFSGMGVAGAAVATVISRGGAALAGFWLLFSGRLGFALSLSDLWPDRETVWKILDVGGPAGLERSADSLAYTGMTVLVAMVGTNAVAAYGVGNRINTLVYLPAVGLAQGVETAVGQNLGADQSGRARRAVLLAAGLGGGVFLLASLSAYAFAAAIVALFFDVSKTAPEVLAMGADYFRIIGPTYVFMGLFHLLNAAFRGAGSTRTALGFSIASQWFFRIPPTLVLITAVGMGAMGVWWGIAVSHVAAAALVGVWFLVGDWDESVVDEDDREDRSDDEAAATAD
ncbi:MATE family efflux transporter [Halomicroarcula sp. F13]|uniref:MATE family efflux transporter n=1 Tax=Haloarcula rubra TaxID=2487747 RepID=A0AAW4PPI1_9EURY|nr:MATE family efflux transporter [Halomicroarcula rubra]MBX0322636.1 MATE family efflux transporter [Halomicroarcula rubra]